VSRRITELTGLDPRKLTDLLETIRATHVVTGQDPWAQAPTKPPKALTAGLTASKSRKN
jgi:hypothetical protein